MSYFVLARYGKKSKKWRVSYVKDEGPSWRQIELPKKQGYRLYREARFGKGFTVSGPRLKTDKTILRYVSGTFFFLES